MIEDPIDAIGRRYIQSKDAENRRQVYGEHDDDALLLRLVVQPQGGAR